jgi:hypothetical protein
MRFNSHTFQSGMDRLVALFCGRPHHPERRQGDNEQRYAGRVHARMLSTARKFAEASCHPALQPVPEAIWQPESRGSIASGC